jgi:hypothetical protein|tara:strand:+ start:215 stop:598 length:384 start_codon:yes stop_codon:yes gene_type:complete
MLKIKMDSYLIMDALIKYLTNDMGVKIDEERLRDYGDIWIKKAKENLDDYKTDEVWDGNEFVVKKEYHVEGLYVKRRNKKTNHVSYKEYRQSRYLEILDWEKSEVQGVTFYVDAHKPYYADKKNDIK